MPFSTVGQEWIFLGCLLAGIVMGLAYEAGYILRFCFTTLFKESKPSPSPEKTKGTGGPEKKPSSKKSRYFNSENLPAVIFSFIIDIVFFGICFVLVLFSAEITADGQVFWFSIAAYLLGFAFERITLGIIVAKFINMIYNTFTRVLESIKKIKFFGKLFR